MTTLNVSLPEALQKFVEAQAAEGGYGTPGEYVSALIREAHKRKANEKLEALILEGLQSEPSEMTATDWEELKRSVWERHARREGQGR
jgi:antitoxin ParD1/3/4